MADQYHMLILRSEYHNNSGILLGIRVLEEQFGRGLQLLM